MTKRLITALAFLFEEQLLYVHKTLFQTKTKRTNGDI